MNKYFENISGKLAEKLKKKNKMTLIVIIGIIGIALLLFSEIFKQDNKVQKGSITDLSVNNEEYKNAVQDELVNILQEIEGVGEVRVMVTLEGSTEYVYAEEYNTKQEDGENKVSSDYQNKYLVVDKGSTKEPVVKKILKPQIAGVIVVCQGGGKASVNEKIYQAVSAVLNIPTNRICVAKG